jgi:GTPase
LFDRPGSGERAILVCVGLGHAPDPDRVEEFVALARSAGAEVLEVLVATRKFADPRFFLGTGKVEELRQRLVALGADLVVVDHALSPGQERNLEKELNCRVLDRSGLILDIFAQRARTFEGKLQVELAQLEHMSTRLVRGWTHLERQKGGIGLRGPGETQLETDRRLIGRRIKTLNDRLDKVLVQRETTRQERRRGSVPTVALVGYTNAGKSTLFNRLTSAGAYTADQLFATLDPTVRRLRLAPGLEVALADTVGFVRDLPHELVAAFRSTLQEAREADLLLHVIDAADPERADRILQVNEVLESIGAQALPQIAVFNKIDRSGEAPHVEFDADGRADRLWLSAHTGAGVDLLRDALHAQLGADLHHCILTLPAHAGRARAQFFEAGAVLAQRQLGDGSIELEVNLRHRDVARICRDAGLELPAAIEPCAPGERFLQSPGRAVSDTAGPAATSGPDVPLTHRPQAIGSN